jgi:trimeric autotransporter adhesin
MADITLLPSAKVPLIYPDTSGMTTEWYRFFWNVYGFTGDATGAVPVSKGGTGLTSIGEHQLIIGNAAGVFEKTELIGSGITITYAPGTTTLAIGNSGVTPGTYGSASAVGQFTVDAKGTLVFAQNVTIGIDATQIISGTIASARISGSYTGITGVGTLTVGTWNATTIGTAYGGTGLTSFTSGGALYATSASVLTSGTLPTTAGGTGLVSFTSGGALYATSTSALTSGTLPVTAGGTGQTSFTNGQLLIGNTTGNTLTKATLTAGSGVSITNGAGSITISATGSGGTVTAVTGVAPIASSGGTTPAISISQSNTTTDGYLSSTDWNTFNNKQPAGTYVTSISIASSNGFTGTSSGGATPSLTLATSVTGILKGNGTAISAATSGTDYAPATSGTSILYGNGAGGFSNVTIGTGVSFASGTLSATGSGGTVTSVSGTGTVNGITLTGTVTSSGSLTLGGILGGIGNSQLTNSTISGVALGGNLFNLTAGTGVSFSTGTTYNGSAAITINATGSGGTVTSVAALTLGTTGTDLSSTVANSTTTPVITLNVPTASATNRGALSSTDWSTFNNKAPGVTFTANYIPYGQGTTTLNQSSGLQYDGSNLTVTNNTNAVPNIRINNPNAGSSAGGQFIWGNDADSAIAYIQQNSSTNTTLGGGNSLNIFSKAGNFTISTVNTERLRVTSNGGVSFGATGTAYGTSGQILQSNGDAPPSWINNTVGTVTSVAALTLGTTGTDLSSTVANSTTTPVITLNVPTASATNRGVLSAADWTTFNSKAPGVIFTTGYIPFGQGTTTLNQDAGLFWDNTNKRLGIGTAVPAFKFDLYSNTAGLNLVATGDGFNSNIIARSYGGNPSFQIRKYNGTLASPTAVTTGQTLSQFISQGYGGTTLRTLATITSYVGTYVSDTDISTYTVFGNTPAGSSSPSEIMRTWGSGGVSIGNTTDPGATNLSVTGTATAAIHNTLSGTTGSVANGASNDFVTTAANKGHYTVSINAVGNTTVWAASYAYFDGGGTGTLVTIGAVGVTITSSGANKLTLTNLAGSAQSFEWSILRYK